MILNMYPLLIKVIFCLYLTSQKKLKLNQFIHYNIIKLTKNIHMKKSKMFFDVSRLKSAGLIFLFLLTFSFTGNAKQSNSFLSSHSLPVIFAQAGQTKTNNVTAKKDNKRKKESAIQEDRPYDRIDPQFRGIGPGNNRIKFIISVIVLLLAFGGMIKGKGIIKKVSGIVALLAFGMIARITYVEARALGRQHGYAPVQPIWFSHKIHVTQNKIDCEFCHVDARTSRHAGVPSLNVCMNCHNQVKEGSISGKKEISKIYEHLGLDPNTLAKVKPGTPVQWVKVHNLPDHVYFNHAQHVQAGKVACQECHGPVEEMNRVVEYKELAMGDFCLDCHRKRGIDTSNPYYKHYNFKKLMEEEGVDKITVDKIGGDNCSSCHY